jgi:hypothetical protein
MKFVKQDTAIAGTLPLEATLLWRCKKTSLSMMRNLKAHLPRGFTSIAHLNRCQLISIPLVNNQVTNQRPEKPRPWTNIASYSPQVLATEATLTAWLADWSRTLDPPKPPYLGEAWHRQREQMPLGLVEPTRLHRAPCSTTFSFSSITPAKCWGF